MLNRPDKFIAALIIVLVGLLTALLPAPDFSRLVVMAVLLGAAVITELLL
jgi:1,4-dihydroxy-2-naphthoate octaprenyltransferase